MPRRPRAPELDPRRTAKAADVPLWFVAAFEDGKETPGFLVCWEMAIGVALGDPGADEPRRELGRDPPLGSEEQVNAYVMEQLKALSE